MNKGKKRKGRGNSGRPGPESLPYGNGLGFFAGKLELLFVPALPYVLLRAPVEERYRAHRLLDTNDLQRGPIHTCLLPH